MSNNDDDDPFADLDEEPDADLDADELFVEMDVGEVDEEALWADIAAEEERGDAVADTSLATGTETEGETAVVPKSRYCQSCEYFSEPPEISCSHEGTEIVEGVDMDSFRVRNCPVVAKRRGSNDGVLSDR